MHNNYNTYGLFKYINKKIKMEIENLKQKISSIK